MCNIVFIVVVYKEKKLCLSPYNLKCAVQQMQSALASLALVTAMSCNIFVYRL